MASAHCALKREPSVFVVGCDGLIVRLLIRKLIVVRSTVLQLEEPIEVISDPGEIYDKLNNVGVRMPLQTMICFDQNSRIIVRSTSVFRAPIP